MVSAGGSTTYGTVYREIRRREGVLARAAMVLFLLVGAAIFYIWSHAQLMHMGMEVSDLDRERVEVLKENQRLRLERASLRNLNRIENYATNRLGMTYPDPAGIHAVWEP